MRKISLLLACLAYAGHGRPAQKRLSTERKLPVKSIDTAHPLKALAMILTSIPGVAFTPSQLGAHSSVAVSRPVVLDRHVGHRISVLMNAKASAQEKQDIFKDLPPPPTKKMFLQNIRETFDYLQNPDAFIQKRAQELGPVFVMYQFFAPVLVVGGQEAVKEFISERELKSSVIYPQLPDTFLELHSKWGALNMDANDILFKQSRELFGDVLASKEALTYYVKTIEPQIEEYVDKLVERATKNPDEEFFMVPEIKELCLQIFSSIFTGQGLTKEQVQMYIDYNDSLLSISKSMEGYKKGKLALDTMKAENLRRFHALDDPDIPLDTPGKFYHSKVSGRPGWEGEEGQDRTGTGMVLFIWGAYIECASLMIDSLALMSTLNPGSQDNVVEEFQQQKAAGIDQSDLNFWNGMPYTRGVMRETLRVAPPGAGVPRFGNDDFALQGYRIPAKMAVMLEPRIGNMDPDLYIEPEKFEPYRWVKKDRAEEPTSKCPFQGTALKLGSGSFFPGGNGAHRCPGIPLAELVGTMFVAKMSERFEKITASGSGLDKNGEIEYVKIPVRIPPDNFGLKLQPAKVKVKVAA